MLKSAQHQHCVNSSGEDNSDRPGPLHHDSPAAEEGAAVV